MEKEKVNSGVDLCLVLDVSVSMTDVIEEDNVEYGSRFKVAKKAVESLIKNSSDEDNLSLITYNDLPKIVFKNISGSDKDFMLSELNKVTASGNTNISAAIREARILMKEEVSDKVKKIINTEEPKQKNEKASDMMIGKWVKCDECKEIIEKLKFNSTSLELKIYMN